MNKIQELCIEAYGYMLTLVALIIAAWEKMRGTSKPLV